MPTLKHPIATEKAIGLITKSNVIVYIVDTRSTKNDVKKEFERLFSVKVASVHTANMPNNTRKAFIKVAKGFNASDVAMKLKLV
jgi:ribosomal protein L23